MWTLVGLLSLLGLAVGLISIIYPLQIMYIASRSTAVRVVASSLILICISVGAEQRDLAIFLTLLSLLFFAAGAISIIYPIRSLFIYSRSTAARVIGVSLALLCSGFVLALASAPHPARQEQAVAAPKSISPPDDGCGLAGAIPNCKEQVAKMVATQAALPPLPPEPPAGSDRTAAWIREVLQDAQKVENETKAAEASGNVRALAAKRELDRAEAEDAAAHQSLRNSMDDAEAKGRQAQAEFDRAKYGIGVEQRKLEALQKQSLEELERKEAEARQRGYGYNR